jgi:hypothetical protein
MFCLALLLCLWHTVFGLIALGLLIAPLVLVLRPKLFLPVWPRLSRPARLALFRRRCTLEQLSFVRPRTAVSFTPGRAVLRTGGRLPVLLLLCCLASPVAAWPTRELTTLETTIPVVTAAALVALVAALAAIRQFVAGSGTATSSSEAWAQPAAFLSATHRDALLAFAGQEDQSTAALRSFCVANNIPNAAVMDWNNFFSEATLWNTTAPDVSTGRITNVANGRAAFWSALRRTRAAGIAMAAMETRLQEIEARVESPPAWLPAFATRDWFAGVTTAPVGSSLAATAARAAEHDTLQAQVAQLTTDLATARAALAAAGAGTTGGNGRLEARDVPVFDGTVAAFRTWRTRVENLVAARGASVTATQLVQIVLSAVSSPLVATFRVTDFVPATTTTYAEAADSLLRRLAATFSDLNEQSNASRDLALLRAKQMVWSEFIVRFETLALLAGLSLDGQLVNSTASSRLVSSMTSATREKIVAALRGEETPIEQISYNRLRRLAALSWTPESPRRAAAATVTAAAATTTTVSAAPARAEDNRPEYMRLGRCRDHPLVSFSSCTDEACSRRRAAAVARGMRQAAGQ